MQYRAGFGFRRWLGHGRSDRRLCAGKRDDNDDQRGDGLGLYAEHHHRDIGLVARELHVLEDDDVRR
jgi:hypothetical protein